MDKELKILHDHLESLNNDYRSVMAENKRLRDSVNNQIKYKEKYKEESELKDRLLTLKNLDYEEMKDKYELLGDSSSDLKAKFIGEYKWIEHETYLDDCGEEASQACERVVSWTMLKDIYKQMTQYVKDRNPKDFRP